MRRYRFDDKVHRHLLDEKPLYGTSTVVQVLSKNLTWWSAELAAVTCLEVGEKIPTIRKEYLEAVASTDKKKAIDKLQKKYPIFKTARFAHYDSRNEKAEKGIDLHAELERFINWKIQTIDGYSPVVYPFSIRIKPFTDWSEKNVKKFLWSEAHCYSEKQWTGGIVDAGALLNNGSIALIDFKSAKEVFFNHWCQVAGYAIAVEENGLFDKDGNILPLAGFASLDRSNESKIDKLIIVPFGAEKAEPVFNPLPISDYKEAFISCVNLNRIMGKDKKE